ncbi:hypothetical protein [Microlunatus sp. Y2014]|uniref:hypothetical protein n=1 Tax=Microlunatus sp. Y2014 TaxID=3418488 RepID=UPI003DA6DDCB
MTDQRRQLRALVDESQTPDGHTYLLCAAVVDPKSATLRSLMAELEEEARTLPGNEIHATVIARNPRFRVRLDTIEERIRDSSAVKFYTAVRAPIARNAAEQGRQICLAQLAVDLVTRHQVGEVVLDSRDGSSETKQRRGSQDALDIATLRELMGEGRLPRTLRVSHRQDRVHHPLWLADVGAYAVQRTLSTGDPTRLSRLASRMELREARVQPIAQREEGRPLLAPNGLELRLSELLTVAEQRAAARDRELGYATEDQSVVDHASERLHRARQQLDEVIDQMDRWEQRRGALPPLDEYVHPQHGREHER